MNYGGRHRYSIGVDVGGHNIVTGVARDGEYLKKHQRSVMADNRASTTKVIKQIADAVENRVRAVRIRPFELEGVTVAIPGPTDGETVFKLTNFPNAKDNIKLKKRLGNELYKRFKTRIEVSAANDATAMTAAEWTDGAGVGKDGRRINEMSVLGIGTGIGGGNVRGGKVHFGAFGASGESGHLHVVDPRSPKARKCGCGGWGHAEAHASTTAIENMAMERRAYGGWEKLLKRGVKAGKLDRKRVDKLLEEGAKRGHVPAEAVFLIADKMGDKKADAVLTEAAYHLTSLISDIHHLANPEMIILGGGAGRAIAPRVKKEFLKRGATTPTKKLKIVPAKLGDNAGVMGATLWPHLMKQGLIG